MRSAPAAPTALRSNDPCWCGSGRKYKRCHKELEGRIVPGTISPTRTVPPEIERPPYAETRRRRPPARAAREVARRSSSACVAPAGRPPRCSPLTGAAVRPGITTDELDAICHAACIERGGYPSPLNYNGFPKSLCTSVNEVICHGIPDDRPLVDGDIVNLDVTIYRDGVHGDTNATFLVGDVDDGLEAPGAGHPRVPDARHRGGEARAAALRHRAGDRAPRHEAARSAWCAPSSATASASSSTPTCRSCTTTTRRLATVMEPGMTFTIEPMITMGRWQHRMWDDGWTAVTVDGGRTAQFEHTILVTDDGAEILTLAD